MSPTLLVGSFFFSNLLFFHLVESYLLILLLARITGGYICSLLTCLGLENVRTSWYLGANHDPVGFTSLIRVSSRLRFSLKIEFL